MKKLLIFIVVLILFATAFASENWVGFTSNSEEVPQVTVVESDNSKLVLDITIPGMKVYTIEEKGETFQRLELVKNHTTYDVGKPELPMINKIIGIPDNQRVRVKILEETTSILDNYNIYPFQTPTKDEKPQKFVIDRSFYNSRIIYPEQNVFLANPGIWRDVKITGFHFVPFKYNPSNKELEVTTSIKVEIEFYGFDTENVLNKDKNLTPDFYKMYDSAIINFNLLGYTTDNTRDISIKYLIVTNTSALTAIQPFADWKMQQGFPVEVRTLETGFQTTGEIKDYISQLYNSDDLEYVLLVGDAYPSGGTGPDNVPMNYWTDTYSDIWYVCMDGPNDYYADLAVGRITYDTPAELELQMQKLMDHYQNPDTSTNWGENSILVAHLEQYPQKYTLCKEQIRTFNYSLQSPIFEQCYGGAGATNNDIIDFVNSTSCGIFNYRGHGSETEFWQWGASGSFTNTHIQQFTNANRYFVLFDVCCSNMDIVGYNGNCLCESFMKSPVAAIAINGAIEPSYTIPNHDYDKEMYKAIFDQGINNIGYITNYANVYVVNNHPSYGPPNFRTYLWLGDSSLEPWTLQPADLIVSHDAQLFLGLSTFDVTVMGTGGPLENARVCVSNDDSSIYGIAFTDASGFAQVQFDEPVQTPGTAKVTVTSHNFLPYQQDIPVIPQSGPYVIYESFLINDSAGNNNDLMDYNESILLTLSVENVGIAVANNVTVTLSTTDLYVTFTDDTEVYGDIPAGGIVTVNDGFAFDVANDIPDGHYVLFDVSATDGTDVWESSFSIEAHAPMLSAEEFIIDDVTGNNNGRLDPGETVTVLIPTVNEGSSTSPSAIGTLTCAEPLITIDDETYILGEIVAGGSVDAIYTVTADPGIPVGTPLNFVYDVDADAYSIQNNFAIVVGLIVEDFETNNFESFDWQFGGNADWVISTGAYEGTYCAQSGSISHNQTSSLYLEVNVLSDGELSFYKKVSSESGWDYLLFFVDNNEMGSWSGNIAWSQETYQITSGEHTFKWEYDKDGSVSTGSDCGWIDYILFPPISIEPMGIVSGVVTDISTGLPIENADIAGLALSGPDGFYSFEILEGTYDLTCIAAGYYELTVEDVMVSVNQTTTVDFALEAFAVPEGLSCMVVDYNDVELTWDVPETTGDVPEISRTKSTSRSKTNTKRIEEPDNTRDLIGYKVYRDGVEIAEITDPAILTYTDLALAAGDYEYYVTAIYDIGESLPSNIEIVTITLPAPQNTQAVTQGQDILITWDAPPPRALSHYKVYRNIVLIANNVTETSYLDESIPAGTYTYNIKAVYDGGYESEFSDDEVIEHEPTDVEDILIPTKTELAGNYPNPFNPTTTISFSLKADSKVVLEIFNIKGQKIRTLVNNNMNAGFYNVVWNGKDDKSRNVASGIYLSIFDAEDNEGDFTSVKKMILLK